MASRMSRTQLGRPIRAIRAIRGQITTDGLAAKFTAGRGGSGWTTNRTNFTNLEEEGDLLRRLAHLGIALLSASHG
jgi:hypothetical protein